MRLKREYCFDVLRVIATIPNCATDASRSTRSVHSLLQYISSQKGIIATCYQNIHGIGHEVEYRSFGPLGTFFMPWCHLGSAMIDLQFA
mmetsp:Transcript_21641/g.37979  ORF Transcript_21641/g.37979 Transcript_21641/m.37979 type:complete len:89 (+) Transcript_21641:449-715(+)